MREQEGSRKSEEGVYVRQVDHFLVRHVRNMDREWVDLLSSTPFLLYLRLVGEMTDDGGAKQLQLCLLWRISVTPVLQREHTYGCGVGLSIERNSSLLVVYGCPHLAEEDLTHGHLVVRQLQVLRGGLASSRVSECQ